MTTTAPTIPASLDPTGREIEVLAHMADGLSNPEIARKLSLTDATVKTHVRRTRTNSAPATDTPPSPPHSDAAYSAEGQ